jgi:hypothetical protein
VATAAWGAEVGADSAHTSWRRKRGGVVRRARARGGWRLAEVGGDRHGTHCRAIQKSRGGGVRAHGPLWASRRGLGPEKSAPFYFFEKISNQFELIRLNNGLPKFIKFQINYGCEGFEVRNNFPYRNFLILKNNFGLKFKEFSRV